MLNQRDDRTIRRRYARPRRAHAARCGGSAASAAPSAAASWARTGRADGPDRLHRVGQAHSAQDQPFKGKTVDIQVQWTRGELTNFQNSLADFAKATGITIQVDSVPSSHETVLKSRIEGGSPPDIAQLAQPTPVLAYAAEGKVIDLATFMDANKLND